jgi:hypothetical protein
MVFLLVAMSDGAFNRRETARFKSLCAEALTSQDELFRRVITRMLPNLERYVEDLTDAEFNYLTELETLNDILNRGFPDSAAGFKLELFSLAQSIAEAAGGSQTKVTREENLALAGIATTLGIL